MREFTKSLFSYSLALSLFGLKQVENMLRPTAKGEHKGPAAKAFDSVTSATVDQFGETLRSTFRTADNLQRGLVELTFRLMFPFEDRRGTSSDREDVPAPEASYGSEPQRWTEVMERRTGTG